MPSVVKFPEKTLLPITEVKVHFHDYIEPLEISCTAFGNAEGNNSLLVFYDDNVSEAPIAIVNSKNIDYVTLSPLKSVSENEEASRDPNEGSSKEEGVQE